MAIANHHEVSFAGCVSKCVEKDFLLQAGKWSLFDQGFLQCAASWLSGQCPHDSTGSVIGQNAAVNRFLAVALLVDFPEREKTRRGIVAVVILNQHQILNRFASKFD